MKARVAFRVDASRQIGIGHFMRCLTLADAMIERNARVRFVSRHLPGHLRATLRERGVECSILAGPSSGEPRDGQPYAHWLGTDQVTDAQDTVRALSGDAWDWVVLDHYALDAAWEAEVRVSAGRVLVIDDLANRPHDCDVLLDQNFYRDKDTRYIGLLPGHCKVLVGPRYALLQNAFQESREHASSRAGIVKRVLVCFGGVDADNYTGTAIQALSTLETELLTVDVVIGADHSDRAGIERACAGRGFACHVQSDRLAELMSAADLGIGAGGSTTWERCCVGLPTLVLALAENQRKLIRDSAAEGIIYAPDVADGRVSPDLIRRHLHTLIENSCLRQSLSRRGMETVDGRGVARALRQIGMCDVEIEEAGPSDSVSLFEWRNHPSIRAMSHDTAAIGLESHQRWFAAVLNDPDRLLLIGRRHGTPIGVVRFDIKEATAEISIYLVPGTRLPGAGSELLGEAEHWLSTTRPDLRRCVARVLGQNARSHRLFTGAGYALESVVYTKDLIPA